MTTEPARALKCYACGYHFASQDVHDREKCLAQLWDSVKRYEDQRRVAMVQYQRAMAWWDRDNYISRIPPAKTKIAEEIAPDLDEWRSWDLDEYVSWLTKTAQSRGEFGKIKYGAELVGDPLEHAIEEVLDLLFHLWTEKRKRGAGGIS